MTVAQIFAPAAQDFAIKTARLTLRLITRADRAAWLRVRCSNYQDLQQWDPSWSADSLSYMGIQQYEEFSYTQYTQKNALLLVIQHNDTGHLIGGCEAVRFMDWPVQSAMVGYWIDQQHRGQGMMPEALTALCKYLHVHGNLRKIDAAVLPHNHASQRVLAKTGFVREGLLSDFAEINGKFEAHFLYGLRCTGAFEQKQM